MKQTLALFVVSFLSIAAYGRTAHVTLIDIDGQTTHFTFFDSKSNNLITSHLHGTFCSLDFVQGKLYVELACIPTAAFSGKGRFTRTFTRATCNGRNEALMIVNTSETMAADSPMEAMSITATCE